MAYETIIVSDNGLASLQEALDILSSKGWIVRAGWFALGRHNVTLQRQRQEAEYEKRSPSTPGTSPTKVRRKPRDRGDNSTK